MTSGTMKTSVALVIVSMALARGAYAQSPAATSTASSKGYVEAVAQSAFSNVTSQSFGGELGVTLGDGLQLFVEGGMIRDAATSDISSGATQVALALGALQPAGVSYAVKEPVSFGVAGLRYVFSGSRVQPYVLAGGGVARVKKDVRFQLDGVDASSSLAQYVTLGSDLSGTTTKPMLSIGAGAVWSVWKRLIVDFQYRYGRIFDDTPIKTSRAGAGIGVRF
jgi:opacity protein-like surface antigen